MPVRTWSIAWLSAIAASLAGLLGIAFGMGPFAALLAALGSGVLLAGILRSRTGLASEMVSMVGGAVFLAAGALLDFPRVAVPRAGALSLAALGAQILLLGIGLDLRRAMERPLRLLLPLLGHSLILMGTVFLLRMPGAIVPAAYGAGFALLVLHAQWTRAGQAESEAARSWERGILLVIAGGLVLAMVDVAAGAALGGRVREIGARVALLLALALFAHAPAAPRWLRMPPGGVRQLLSHGVVSTLMLNAALLALFVALPLLVHPVFWLLTGWLALAVAFEYAAVFHMAKRRRMPPDKAVPPLPREPLTVIMAAMNEADVLPEAVRRNLALPLPLRFILVPAIKSKDGTVEAARRLAREHPDRVEVVLGETGSKAGDLTVAWARVRTDVVLILDADETIDEASLARGFDVLRRHPDVGIVQGRKVSREPDASFLARLTNVERRFSTWLDHVFQGEAFGAAHFAGSGALVRREVPPGVGGWSDETLTEDIEFTMRLHRQGRWRILYEPRMVARESDPRSFRDLVRQRARWARGWGQVYQLHLGALLRERRTVGAKRCVGLGWQMLTSVSAPWSVFLPALLVLWLAGASPMLPTSAALLLAMLILPSRTLSFAYAAATDPVIPVRGWRLAEVVALAYLWIFLGWALQLHALYLEVSAAPRTWYGTTKTVAPPPATGA